MRHCTPDLGFQVLSLVIQPLEACARLGQQGLVLHGASQLCEAAAVVPEAGQHLCPLPALHPYVALQLFKGNAIQPQSGICHLHLNL